MSSGYEDRVEAKHDLVVYGLVLQHSVVFFIILGGGLEFASGIIQKVASAYL